MTEQTAPSFFERLKNLTTLWRDYSSARGEALPPLKPDLPEDDVAKVRHQMQACLEGRGGDVSARARAAELGRAFLSLDDAGRERFLRVMAGEFDTDHDAVTACCDQLAKADTVEARDRAEQALRAKLEAPRVNLLTQFNALPDGVKFLVDMRAQLLPLARKSYDLKGLEGDLKGLLMSWFDVGFLELKRLTWSSPAVVLEKIIAYEAVHTIHGWDDLKNRLDSDRRLYAFFHPRMKNEPLIFVEVALVNGMAGHIQPLLDTDAPVVDPASADAAIFYSINNAQRGLDGISFGNFLIKRVVQELSHEFPNLKTFATLSPIPGFRKWLDGVLAEGEPGLLTASERKVLTAAYKQRVGEAAAAMAGAEAGEGPAEGEAANGNGDVVAGGGKGSLKALLARPEWHKDPVVEQALRGPLLRLGARYLAQEKRVKKEGDTPRALDPVAHFHLSNGARVERVNWLGDTSGKGLKQSCGMMVNYLYKLNEIEKNHEQYKGQGKVVTSSAVRSMAKE
ncbi:Malonyl-CoA decarboxylase [Caenispirillum salinarum AK4]|uniref:Malonyl-CoA decarboxylase n=1 Tax=Caenispirillum salinarum AK4 TaxID=1238182 RepID=K9GR14_9PROT|nr:malonyl-CoA decarboxylase [Caenispirillum salinarum]EKV28425.1 Malonyl-CoA decarboxylase [Caenispirillum salinarum AK4]